MSETWLVYEVAASADYVPIEKWGQDHWDTFGYADHCTVNKRGVLDRQHMRCNPRLHRELANIGNTEYHSLIDGSSHPTRLKGDEVMTTPHDDWSCIEDAVAAGLLIAMFRANDSERMFGNREVRVELTTYGERVAAAFRHYIADGRRRADFVPPSREVPKLASATLALEVVNA